VAGIPVPALMASLLQLQQDFVDLRLGMFVHFNMATYQDREWGDPLGPMTDFNPTSLDTEQWATAAKSAGMTFGCLTTKHHDGFCLWPTSTGSPSVAMSSFMGDVVRSYADSFRKHGLKVGLYYSILDLRSDIRHFNVTHAKIDLIKRHLTELLTSYGEINVLIFDGWDAPWSRISYEEVPFHEIYALVKRLQPNCLICDLNAASYPTSGLYYSDIKAFEQNAGQHLPSGNVLPALTCVTLADGWFFKSSDGSASLKLAAQVVEEWLVPQNRLGCTMVLNAPPDRSGRLAPNVVARLAEIGSLWKRNEVPPRVSASIAITTSDLAHGCAIHASSSADTVGPDLANDGSFRTSWVPDDGQTSGWLEITFRRPVSFNTLALVSVVGASEAEPPHRLASFKFSIPSADGWKVIAEGREPAAVEMLRVAQVTAPKLRLEVDGATHPPHIAQIGVYDEPEAKSA